MGERRSGTGRVAVVGAGIVGVAAALSVLRDGRDVVLIDRHGPGEGASFGNAGVLARSAVNPVPMPGLAARIPGMLASPSSPLFMRWRRLPGALPWLLRYLSHAKAPIAERTAALLAGLIGDSVEDHRRLAARSPAQRYIVPSDYFYIYRTAHERGGDARILSLKAANGFRFEMLDEPGLRAALPMVGDAHSAGVRFPDHGYITDPGAYVKALAGTFASEGGRVLRASAEAILTDGGRTTGVATSVGPVEAATVVVACGAWSASLLAPLGLGVPLESERGYHVEFVEPSIHLPAPVMIAEGACVATPMAGRLRVAGLLEIGGLEAGPSAAPIRLLERLAHRAFPGLTCRETRSWLGHRPATVDSLPVIGALPRHPDVLAAFGHHHVGLTGGPRTGRIVADLIAGRRPNVDLAPFAPGRFARA